MWPGGIQSKVSTVNAAIDLNARILGSLPVYVVRGTEVIPSPKWTTNPAPGLYSTWVEAVEQMVWTYQRRGEIILWALDRFADGSVRHFAVLNPDRVQIERGDDGLPEYTLLGWEDGLFDDGRAYVAKLDREDVLFLPYVRYPGELRGSGPLEWVYNNLLSASAMSQSGTELATRGGVPWAVLNAPYELSDPEVNKLRSQWTDAAAKRGGAPAITSGGFTLVPLTISPKEMALLEIREYDEARIAIALGVQPYQLGLPQGSSLTYTNVSQLFDYHWRSFLRPTSRKLASAISGWALVNGQELRFNPEQYVRPPLEQRVPAYQVLVEMGVITPEEVRIAEDFVGVPPEETGEVEQEVLFG